jgi:RNA polymerase sigma-B factor
VTTKTRAAVSQTLRLLETYNESGDVRARDELVANYAPLVRRMCKKFRASSETQEDLFQVGVIGLLRAIERFDPGYNTSFASLAIPEVLGAILNHLRDHGSLIKMPRALRQKMLSADRVAGMLAVRLGRWPTVAELAEECHLTEDEIYDALELGYTGEPRSLDETVEGEDGDSSLSLSDTVGREDIEFDVSLNRLTLAAALSSLPARERKIVILRYYGGMSQVQTARRIKVSQMHVSRLERGALSKLRLIILSRQAFSQSAGREERSTSSRVPAIP